MASASAHISRLERHTNSCESYARHRADSSQPIPNFRPTSRDCVSRIASAAAAPDRLPDFSFTFPGETNFVTGRVRASNRTLLIDGKPLLVRGCTYSPTPIGKDMSASDVADRIYDFFVEEHEELGQYITEQNQLLEDSIA